MWTKKFHWNIFTNFTPKLIKGKNEKTNIIYSAIGGSSFDLASAIRSKSLANHTWSKRS